MPRRPLNSSASWPAPVGGINTVDAGSAMPETDCVYAYNLIAAENGLRARLGYSEWVTGMTGAADAAVRTVLPFSGGAASGSADKLFAVTQAGIWDCTASTNAPTLAIGFGTTTGNAGFGSAVVMSTYAGRFLVFCDEENGLYVYAEGGAWAKVAVGTNQAWAANTLYTQSGPQNFVVNGGKIYKCTLTGTSAGSGGPTGTGTAIVDGTAKWDYVGAFVGSTIGPSLADQNLSLSADPASFVHVCVWKNRLWFTEKSSSRAWYMAVDSLYGTATSLNFGGKMRAGGPLVGLFNWSYDSGNGLDSLLVGLSTAGDVVIYQGTDPSSVSTFGLKGSWSVGGVPAGRRIATDFGGDMLVMSSTGIIALSKLVVGQPVVAGDRSMYATGKIANLFNAQALTYGSVWGWALVVHPTDNALLALIPTVSGQATNQLAMSFATRGWTQYRDLPMCSAAAWNGVLYFGTPDGRLCKHAGYVDGVLLSNASAYTPVNWSLLTAYRSAGGKQKRVHLVRPTVLSQSGAPVIQATVKFGYDLNEPAAPSGASTSSGVVWDTAKWDQALWQGDYAASQPLQGGAGVGRDVALALRGQAISRTVLVAVDVLFEEGGYL